MDPAQPGVYITWPSFLPSIPANLPPVVPPPVDERSFRSPFAIDKDLYNFALKPEIPLLFAAAYVITVFSLNAYNRNRDWKPWSISRQKWWPYFVIIHNVVLALYSFATFVAMFRAAKETLPSWGSLQEDGFGLWKAKTADALCKLHGPRGFGDAATYNTTLNIWEIKNTAMHLTSTGNPDPTDVGRLWNEGLAFWGWLFYVSKFYEVLDTGIILAKGKRSATLQTYHHAGAMLCMWAGIRYMSPPIWMFVFINSGIHALMYTYFTLSALDIKVPQPLKRFLTSLQIAQFVFGASYAALHLFIQYDIPISTPFQIAHVVERVASSVSSAAISATSAVGDAASSVSSFAESPSIPATMTMGAFIKKMLLRAAGEEGVAERVAMHQHHADALLPGAAQTAVPKIEEKIEKFYERQFETRYRTEQTRINCIDTSGEAFAIYLNLLYLAPLTFLFARFFIRAYTQRGKPKSLREGVRSASDAAKDAKHQTEDSFEKSGRKAEDELQKRGSQAAEEAEKIRQNPDAYTAEAKEKAKRLQEELRKDVEDFKNGVKNRKLSDRVSEAVQDYEGKVKGAASSASEKGREAVEKAKEMVNGKSSSRRSSPVKKAAQSQENESAVEDEPAAKEDQSSPKEGGESKDSGEGLFKRSGAGGEAEKEKPGQDVEAGSSRAVSGTEGSDEKESMAEDKEAQDAKLDDSEATRPGPGEAPPDSPDRDAMGRSGIVVDKPDDDGEEEEGDGVEEGGVKDPAAESAPSL